MKALRLIGIGAIGVALTAACGSSEEDGGKGGSSAGGASDGGTGAQAGSSGAGGTSTGGASDGGSSGAGGSGGIGVGGAGTGGSSNAKLRFVAMGDVGKGNTAQYAVAAAIKAKCDQSGCDFVQLLGDNIYDSGCSSVDDPQWQEKFEKPYADVNVPFWVVLGNHDYGGNGAGYEVARADVQVAYTQKSTKWKLNAKHYLHQEPGVDLFGLDTNESMFNGHAGQKTNVSGWIAASTATWKIAFGHHPYRSNGPHGNAGSYDGVPWLPIVNGAGVKDLMESTICGKVDLYICGHDHSRQWITETCSGTHLIVSGGGASTTELEGNNPTHFQSDKSGFLYVSIDGNSLTGEFYDQNGTLEFTKTITK